jgi:hypothetical protein
MFLPAQGHLDYCWLFRGLDTPSANGAVRWDWVQQGPLYVIDVSLRRQLKRRFIYDV